MRTFRLLTLLAVLCAFPLAALAQDATPEATDDMGMMMSMGVGDDVCPAPTNLPDAVTIGAVFTLSGGASVYGSQQQNAVTLAVDEINAAGYLGEGTTLNVIFEDSASVNEQAISAMTKLVQQDGVVAVLGPTLSREAFAADPVAQEAGVPVMGVSNTATGITDMGEFVFRNSLPESSVIPGTVAQAVELLGLARVAILYANDDDFTISGYEVFEDSFIDAGVDVVAVETYATNDVDFSAQLTNMLGQTPDALVLSALAVEAAQIISQARALGYTGPILGGNGLNSPAIIDQAGEASEGVIVGAAWNVNASDAISTGFTSSYQETFGILPDQFAAQAYTGAWLMATAIRCADSADSAAIRDALAAITDFASPLGSFSFDENRDPVHPPIVQVIQDGAFAVLGGDMDMMDDDMATEEASS